MCVQRAHRLLPDNRVCVTSGASAALHGGGNHQWPVFVCIFAHTLSPAGVAKRELLPHSLHRHPSGEARNMLMVATPRAAIGMRAQCRLCAIVAHPPPFSQSLLEVYVAAHE